MKTTTKFIATILMLTAFACHVEAQSSHMTLDKQTDWKNFNDEVKAFCEKYSGSFLIFKAKLFGEPVFSPVENDSIMGKLRGYFSYSSIMDVLPPCGYRRLYFTFHETDEERKKRERQEREYQVCLDSIKTEERKTAESILSIVYNYWDSQNIFDYQNNRKLFFNKLKEEVNRICISNNLGEKPRNEFGADIFYIKEKSSEFSIQNILDAIIRINKISKYSDFEVYRNMKKIIDDYYNTNYSSLDVCSEVIRLYKNY